MRITGVKLVKLQNCSKANKIFFQNYGINYLKDSENGKKWALIPIWAETLIPYRDWKEKYEYENENPSHFSVNA